MTMQHRICIVFLAGLVAGCAYEYTGEVPDNAQCAPVDDWPSEQVAWEARIFELINYARVLGANCTGNDHYPPTHEYKPHPALVCAARGHSMDMHDRSFFSHTNLDGEGPTDRATSAGFTEGGVVENIGAGYNSPEEQFAGWMSSPAHCKSIMNPKHHYVGIGTFLGSSGYGKYNTANFSSR